MHVTDDVVITEEQLRHIKDNHPEVYINVVKYIKEILIAPDYIIRDKRPNTGLVIKRLNDNEHSMLMVLKIMTSVNKEDYKNSIITGWRITEKRLNNYLKNKEVIYKNKLL